MSEENIHAFCCSNIGITMDGDIKIEEIRNEHGQHYFKASQEIGTIFGSEVDGAIEAIGASKQQALERLKEEQKKLADSLWA